MKKLTLGLCGALLAAGAVLALAESAVPASGGASLAVKGRVNSTPSVAADGRFVAVAWGAAPGQGKTDVFVATSRDGGATFGAPRQVNTAAGEARLGGELPPRVAVVPGRQGGEPQVVVLWTARGAGTSIKIARSTDGGRTFPAPQALQSSGAAGDRGWPSLALDPGGVAHSVWLDHRGHADAAKGGARPHVHGAGPAAADGAVTALRSALHYASAGPGTGSQDRQLFPGVCYCCKTALAVGAGAIYAAWRHVYPGDIRDIAFTVSRDGGRTFAAPARISEDDWVIQGCPDEGPALAVDAAGAVHVVWATVLPGAEPEGALFYAVTRDGRTFTPRTRIPTLGSPKPAHPALAIGPSGAPVVAWEELIGGRRVSVVRAIRAGAEGVVFGAHEVLNETGNATYPVLAATSDGVIAAWTARSGESSAIAVRRIAAAR